MKFRRGVPAHDIISLLSPVPVVDFQFCAVNTSSQRSLFCTVNSENTVQCKHYYPQLLAGHDQLEGYSSLCMSISKFAVLCDCKYCIKTPPFLQRRLVSGTPQYLHAVHLVHA